MKGNLALKITVAALLVVSLLLGQVGVTASPVAAEPQDWDIPGGHFFTQTGKGNMSGFAVTDDNGVAFWSEFKRLGGVNGVGYPVSRRFQWNGFTCQAMQKVVFQWRPDAKSVSFVNVFDLAHDQGKDAWLKTVRQTPEPKEWQEAGLPWEKIVEGRLAVMNNFPAIKQAYLGVGGDPVTMNGLPTTDVVDMGNNYIVRAQRVVIQQWKEDVPWAKKGQVTLGLGGSIAVEAGLLPVPTAGEPGLIYTDKETGFQVSYPYNWHRGGQDSDWTLILEASYVDGDYVAGIGLDIAELEDPPTPQQAAASFNSDASKRELVEGYGNPEVSAATVVTIGDRKVVKQVYGGETEGIRFKAARYAFFEDDLIYWFDGGCAADTFSRHEGVFDWIVASTQPLR